MLTSKSIDSSVENRFWMKVEKTDSCWLWIGARDKRGYGHFKMGNKVVFAHRISMFMATGKPEMFGGHREETSVCHRCDNPSCVNPEHLFLGTQSSNMRDCVNKGRKNAASGDRHGSKTVPSSIQKGMKNKQSKLTDDAVRKIRFIHSETGATLASLAEKFGVHISNISLIVRNKTWKHVL